MISGFIRIVLIITFFNLLFVSLGIADTVYLKNGKKFEGKIIAETDDYIIIFEPKSSWRMVFYKKYIDKIEKEKVNMQKESKESKEDKSDTQDKTMDTIEERKKKPIFDFIFNWFRGKKSNK